MLIEFTKMQGLGNDFVVINATQNPVMLSSNQVRFLADRHLGIGCDQLLLIEAAQNPTADFRYRIFNADGHEVGACGNGARCFARIVYEQGLTKKRNLILETLNGLIQTHYLDSGMVTVNMGIPQFEPEEIPFIAPESALTYPLEVGHECYDISALSIGNPHAIIIVDNVDKAPLGNTGALIAKHVRFPEQVNVSFLEVIDRNHARLRVYERGVGETLACGSGACAAMIAARRRGFLDECCTISLAGGDLVVEWSGEGSSVMMTGPATTVFKGTIEI